MRAWALRSIVSLAAACALASCTVSRISVDTRIAPGPFEGDIRAPLKVFHADGSITLFPRGVAVTENGLTGQGMRHGLDLRSAATVHGAPRDSIVGMQVFRGGLDIFGTALCNFGLAVFDGLSLMALGGWLTVAICLDFYDDINQIPLTGAPARVTYSSRGQVGERRGELVDVRGDGLVLLTSEGLLLVDRAAVIDAEFDRIRGTTKIRGQPRDSELRSLASLARFPFGLRDQQMADLLASTAQLRLVEIRP